MSFATEGRRDWQFLKGGCPVVGFGQLLYTACCYAVFVEFNCDTVHRCINLVAIWALPLFCDGDRSGWWDHWSPRSLFFIANREAFFHASCVTDSIPFACHLNVVWNFANFFDGVLMSFATEGRRDWQFLEGGCPLVGWLQLLCLTCGYAVFVEFDCDAVHRCINLVAICTLPLFDHFDISGWWNHWSPRSLFLIGNREAFFHASLITDAIPFACHLNVV